ncbi:hypothetical protein Tery_4212 [Trichodesmium erythraeum IMS101]|uniref:DUF4935 domain-containing protein n=1 Tax=Trichodesmium erythraeum (strain IMS101) TaxID=203124 RepID=Q10X10_TRIEI
MQLLIAETVTTHLTKTMDIIFIDTSIFESNNFLESDRIKEVYKLAERGEIKVVLPELTYDEILNRISKNIEESSQKFNKYRQDTRILRNIPSLSEKFKPFEKRQVKEELYEIVKEKFSQSNFEIIAYPTLNIKEIFRSYFDKTFPFGSGGKKSEFPDAFTLKSIEIWAEENNVKVLAFSKDKDMLKYTSEHLEIIEDFNKYLSDKIKEIEVASNKKRLRLDQVEDIIQNRPERTQKEIKEWVENQLDNYSKYYDYSNQCEVHDVSIIEVETNIEDYTITNISKDYISVELRVRINYQVQIIIDDEDSIYKDDDTKELFFRETKPDLVGDIIDIDVDLRFYFEPDDDTVYTYQPLI